jgi:hypothetical protein
VDVREDPDPKQAPDDAGHLQCELLGRRQAIDPSGDDTVDRVGHVERLEVGHAAREVGHPAIHDEMARVT